MKIGTRVFFSTLNTNLGSKFKNSKWPIQYDFPKLRKFKFTAKGQLRALNMNCKSKFKNSKSPTQYGFPKFRKIQYISGFL